MVRFSCSSTSRKFGRGHPAAAHRVDIKEKSCPQAFYICPCPSTVSLPGLPRDLAYAAPTRRAAIATITSWLPLNGN